MNPLRIAALTLLLLAPASCARNNASPEARASGTEILWDTWGIPHIYASDAPSLGRAFGWAQMHAHANLLLDLYARARGRSAEYWGGDENAEGDRFVRTLGSGTRRRRPSSAATSTPSRRG